MMPDCLIHASYGVKEEDGSVSVLCQWHSISLVLEEEDLSQVYFVSMMIDFVGTGRRRSFASSKLSLRDTTHGWPDYQLDIMKDNTVF